MIVYAVKPQNVDKVNAEIWRAKTELGGVRDDATILSVAAGKPIQTFVRGSGIERIARSMPNTPAQSEFFALLVRRLGLIVIFTY